MELSEIITAAVEKRVAELVENAINHREEFRPTDIEQAISREVQRIAREEVPKHEVAIRTAIGNALAQLPTTFEISAYTKINLPNEQNQ